MVYFAEHRIIDETNIRNDEVRVMQLAKAGQIANREMIHFLMEKAELSRTEANRLAGIAGDSHFGELSDENALVYMTLPKKVLTGFN